MNKAQKGFTLAELLITLTIIGVVAALSIPALLNSFQKMQTLSTLQTVYQELSQAVLLMQNDNNGSLVGVFPDGNNDAATEQTLNVFAKYLSYSKICYGAASTLGNCFPTNVNTFGSSPVQSEMSLYANGHGGAGASAMILSNGVSLAIVGNNHVAEWGPGGNACTENTSAGTSTGGNVCTGLVQALQGLNGPNILGKDVFYFQVTPNSIIPFNSSGKGACCTTNACGTNGRTGQECSYQIINNDGWQITYY